jgi:hypothetical protein
MNLRFLVLSLPGLIELLEVIASTFWKPSGRVGISSYLNVCLNLPVKPSGIQLSLARSNLIADSISLFVSGLFRLLLLNSALVGLMFLGIYLFLGYQIFSHVIICYSPLSSFLSSFSFLTL